MDAGVVDLERLTQAQAQAARLAHAMAGYVAWLAPQMPTLPGLLRETFDGARARATSGDEHRRVPEVLAHLWLGLHCGLSYAEEIGACHAAEASALRAEGWATLVALGGAQGRFLDDERPTRRFLRVLLALVAQRRGALLPKDDLGDTLRQGVDVLGWQDDEALHLIPETAYMAVARFCREAGEPFAVRQERLAKDLAKEGITECESDRYTRTVRVSGRTRRVWSLRRAVVEDLLGQESPLPSPVVTGITGFGEER